MEAVATKQDVSSSTELTTADYVHLHNHTHHSLLDGLSKIPDLIGKIKELLVRRAV